ncbi:MAG TPA: SdrD B-like domain-containing protein, partial [Methanotrichaceae archaeon]|nr:SdrD B-like domain-containing protein [Methanotrichaceae archaeon]
AGTAPGLSISGVKFNDLNGNGVRDGNEPGIAGWMIHLTRNGGETLDTATDAEGHYSFVGLESSSYIVTEDPSPEVNQSAQADSAYNITLMSKDENHLDFGGCKSCLASSGISQEASPSQNANGTAANKSQESASIAGSLSINGTVFNDQNCDGVRNGNETGLPGWTVHLMHNGADMLNALTDAAGNYIFAGLEQGRYLVAEDLDLGWNQTAPESGAYDLTLADKGVDRVDFGNYKSCLTPSAAAPSNETSEAEDNVSSTEVQAAPDELEPSQSNLTSTAAGSNESAIINNQGEPAVTANASKTVLPGTDEAFSEVSSLSSAGDAFSEASSLSSSNDAAGTAHGTSANSSQLSAFVTHGAAATSNVNTTSGSNSTVVK